MDRDMLKETMTKKQMIEEHNKLNGHVEILRKGVKEKDGIIKDLQDGQKDIADKLKKEFHAQYSNVDNKVKDLELKASVALDEMRKAQQGLISFIGLTDSFVLREELNLQMTRQLVKYLKDVYVEEE